MTPPSSFRRPPSATLLEAVRASLAQVARYNPGDVVAPVTVLWTDADGQWRPVVEQLRELMPALLTLGDYDAKTRTGPAIWLRCVIEPAVRAEKFPDLAWPADTVPVIYMPGVIRQMLRAAEECPDKLKPLVELQYRGTVWTQKNGKDWTIRAFLVSDDGGLGLDVAEDKLTLQAMQGALSALAVTPVTRLEGKRLEAEDFDRLMIGDTPRDLLLWLGDLDGTRGRWDRGKWSAFRSRCRQDYGFDPETDGEIIGGEKLGQRQEAWCGVWERFAESPALYPGISNLLRRAKPRGTLIFEKDPWPDENESMENALLVELMNVGSMKPTEARQRLQQLETEHGPRRKSVWARLGMCPLANALEYLAMLAKRTTMALGGDNADAMATLYAEGGYLADDSAMRTLACVKTAEDTAAVQQAVRCVYLPWLEDTARHFQQCLASKALPAVAQRERVAADTGECILFADGLRFDIGQRLTAMAGERRLEVSAGWRWAALPTVTATAKPAASPVSGKLYGGRLEADFSPEIADGGGRLTIDRFRRLLSDEGFQMVGPGESGDPRATNARGWVEYGEFDKLGHNLQGKMTAQIEDQLELLLERVQGLLEAGWKRVRVVTDHGWLLVPGGMPKVQLPKYLAESRWSRCASIKDSSHVEVPIAGWSWNPHERFAYAPGVYCFVAGQEYAHGGASLQECLVPVLTFASTDAPADVVVTISEVRWVGLRCRVSVQPAVEGLLADLRTKPNVPDSSVMQPKKPKTLGADGKVALLVDDDSLKGTVASLVIVDASGRVLCKEATTVGGDD
ncbi:MAG: BREX-1 system phosphatase PglZ type B [candidate division NC10 bacterium]|nr:BREX-1 system phosphatase PglZ type B [candidate division NC10 bacterium]MDE2321343.1 BREX-1 system phosphatase PglZ type B [candidate division NC10 bacterium]